MDVGLLCEERRIVEFSTPTIRQSQFSHNSSSTIIHPQIHHYNPTILHRTIPHPTPITRPIILHIVGLMVVVGKLWGSMNGVKLLWVGELWGWRIQGELCGWMFVTKNCGVWELWGWIIVGLNNCGLGNCAYVQLIKPPTWKLFFFNWRHVFITVLPPTSKQKNLQIWSFVDL